jgi:hypothetical protein
LGVGCSVGVGCWALGREGVGCPDGDISTMGGPISVPRPALASPGAIVSFLSRACRYLAVGSWALGGAGSPLRRWVPGRWVFEREYLHDQAPDLAPETRYGISGVHIILPKEGLRIGKGWVLGVGCWVLGVGCWALGVGCLNVNIPATGRPIPIPGPDLASPRLTLGAPKRAGLYLAAGFWALGDAGSPPKRWVPKVESLDGARSDRGGSNGVGIARGHGTPLGEGVGGTPTVDPPGRGGSEVSEEVQNRPGYLPRSGEKIFGRWVLKIGRWVFRTGRWVFRIGRWVMGRVGRWVSGGQQVPRGRRQGHPGSRRAAARSGAGGGGEGSRRTR